MMRLRAMLVPILCAPLAVLAQPAPSTSRVGDVYEIVSIRDSFDDRGVEGSGSSHDQDTIVERVIAVTDAGLELEYDLPKTASKQERASNWEFPARVFKPVSGSMQMRNVAEREARLSAWLKAAKWPRTVCGKWIFTWNAFRIECDPQAVLKTIADLDLRSADLRESGLYHDRVAQAPAVLTISTRSATSTILTASMLIDPEAIRRNRAENDVVLGQFTGKPVTLDMALRMRSAEKISGTIAMTVEADAAGSVRRRTKITTVRIAIPGKAAETNTTTETVDRRLVSMRATELQTR